MSPRPAGLLTVLALLLVVRLAAPTKGAPPGIVEPVPAEQRARPASAAEATSAAMVAASAPVTGEDDVPGNAFAVRTPPQPIAPPPAPVVAAAPPRVVSPLPPLIAPPMAEPPPPQVIGTYDDGRALAVFFATPGGTQLAREGSAVADYRVTGITKQSVSLVHESTQRALQVAVPPGSGS